MLAQASDGASDLDALSEDEAKVSLESLSVPASVRRAQRLLCRLLVETVRLQKSAINVYCVPILKQGAVLKAYIEGSKPVGRLNAGQVLKLLKKRGLEAVVAKVATAKGVRGFCFATHQLVSRVSTSRR